MGTVRNQFCDGDVLQLFVRCVHCIMAKIPKFYMPWSRPIHFALYSGIISTHPRWSFPLYNLLLILKGGIKWWKPSMAFIDFRGLIARLVDDTTIYHAVSMLHMIRCAESECQRFILWGAFVVTLHTVFKTQLRMESYSMNVGSRCHFYEGHTVFFVEK